jgi:hypothetical protein
MASHSGNPAFPRPSTHVFIFRRKAAECQRQADLAKYGETQEAFRKLALGYEKLAAHAESIERQATSKRRKKN